MLSHSPDSEALITEPRKLVRIGELLTIAGIVTHEQLREGLRRAAETDLPLGKILVWSGYVTDETLRQVVHVQCLLNDKAIHIDDAVSWLSQDVGKKIPDRALAPIPQPEKEATSHRLGELLLAAGMITEQTLDEALADSLATGLPLGRILVYTKNVPDLYISAALDAQVATREHRINREAAIDAMRIVKSRNCGFDAALNELGFSPDKHGFSQLISLLRVSGVISESKLTTAQEMSISKGKPLADILIEFRFLDARVVRVALTVTNDLVNGAIPMSKAISLLRRTVENKFDDSDAQGTTKSGTVVSASDLLKLARLIDADQIKRVSPPELQTFSVTNSRQENVDQTLTIALKCVDLIERKEMTLEQAIVVLHFCCRKNIALPVVLGLMGVYAVPDDV
jgi:hypothetical protein